MQAAVPPQAAEPLRNDAQQAFATKLGSETDGLRKTFYLITFSRILDETLIAAGGQLQDAGALARQQIATTVRNAFSNPVPPPGGGGRPRNQPGNIVKKLVDFLEQHADASKH